MEKQIQVTSGNGPKECDYFVQHILDIICRQAAAQKISCKIESQEFRDQLLCSFVLRLTGYNAELFVRSWLGSICWVSRSPFRPAHKRKNWFIMIHECISPAPITLHERDILYQTMRSSGPGGQHVNKVNSAVRALHMPSGIAVQVMDTRSQVQNKKIAYLRIADKLVALHQESIKNGDKALWEMQLQLQRGDAKRVFTGNKFKEMPKSGADNDERRRA